MGCGISSENEITLKYRVQLVLIEKDKSHPTTFRFNDLANSLIEKNENNTLLQDIEGCSNQILSTIFQEERNKRDSILCIYVRKEPIIKSLSQLSDFRPMQHGHLNKIIIILTSAAIDFGLTNESLSLYAKNIPTFINLEVDFAQLKEKVQTIQNPLLTEDSLNISSNEEDDFELADEKKPGEHDVIIQGNLTNKKLKEVIKELDLVVKNPGKEKKKKLNEQDFKYKIHKVVIKKCSFPDLGIFEELIARLIQFENLKKFYFQDNVVGNDFQGWQDILELVEKNEKIRYLDLSGCNVMDNNLRDLINGISDKRLRYLSLCGNFLTEAGAEVLGNYLRNNKTIQVLKLAKNSQCQFKSDGVKHIVDGLISNPNIKIVDFSYNEITGCGIHIVTLIKNCKSLREIFLRSCKLNYGDFKTICGEIKENNTIDRLDIGLNDMGGDKSLEEIANMIIKNTHLTDIGLDQLNINMENYDIIFNALDRNETINKIHISFNSNLKPKLVLDYFFKRKSLEFFEFIPYNKLVDKNKSLSLEDRKLIEKFYNERPEVRVRSKE